MVYHEKFKVTQYKKFQESKFARGRRRYDREQQSFGGHLSQGDSIQKIPRIKIRPS